MTSSQKLKTFLEENKLSKKELANMIGVTQSYVYNLADERVPFSTKRETIERLAVVMGIEPSEFKEYISSSKNPYYINNSAGAKFLEIRENYEISNLELLKKVPRELQLKVVDILRGDANIPPDITLIKMLLGLLSERFSNSDCLVILEAALRDACKQAGTILNEANIEMIKTMAKYYLESR